MNYDAFLDDCYNDPSVRERGRKFIARLDKIVGDIPLQQALSNERIITDIFYSKVTSDVSKAHFFDTKRHLLKLVEWLEKQDLLSNNVELIEEIKEYSFEDILSLDKISNTYFANYESAIQYVDTIGEQCIEDYNIDDTLNIKAYITLLWVGLDAEDAVLLRKNDLVRYNDRGREVFLLVIPHKKRTVLLQDKQFEILYQCAQSISYRGLPSGKKIYYKETDLLLRAKAKDCLNTNNIMCAFKRFNEVARQCGEQRILLSSILQKNGLFESIYQNETKFESITKALMQMTGCDRTFAFAYKHSYLAWKQRYYPQ